MITFNFDLCMKSLAELTEKFSMSIEKFIYEKASFQTKEFELNAEQTFVSKDQRLFLQKLLVII